VLLIAFSFGAIIEGTSGFGTPVAWGAIGTPIVTLAAVSGLDQVTLSAMAGHLGLAGSWAR
jgi:lactate permease